MCFDKWCAIAENRPYWFDIKKEMTDIWELVKSVKKAITDTVAQLQSKKDDVAKRFTGVDLVSMLHDWPISTGLLELLA